MSKTLKLFVLKDSDGVIVTDSNGVPLYFNDKMVAKAAKPHEGYTISYGPDHHRYKGGNKT